MIPPLGNGADHANAFGYYFRPDPIARQQCDRQRVHTRLECVDSYVAIAASCARRNPS